MRSRGSASVSPAAARPWSGETFNSNTLNLGVGVLVPALFTPLGVLTATGKLQLTWLIAMTVRA